MCTLLACACNPLEHFCLPCLVEHLRGRSVGLLPYMACILSQCLCSISCFALQVSIKDVALMIAEAMDFKGKVVFDTSKAVRVDQADD